MQRFGLPHDLLPGTLKQKVIDWSLDVDVARNIICSLGIQFLQIPDTRLRSRERQPITNIVKHRSRLPSISCHAA
jgi:hypothetical protein